MQDVLTRLRENFWAVLILFALVFSFTVTFQQAAKYADEVRSDSVESCVRANSRSAVIAAYQMRTSTAWKGKDADVQRDYEAYALGTLQFLAVPREVTDRRVLAESVVSKVNGVKTFTLTERAQSLIRTGCEEAYESD
jgi:hypothetical protein